MNADERKFLIILFASIYIFLRLIFILCLLRLFAVIVFSAKCRCLIEKQLLLFL